MSLQYGELRPTSGWDCFVSLGDPGKFQQVSRLGSVTARHSTSGRQPNCGVEQRAPPIFGRAAITLGIGLHFYFVFILCCSIFMFHMNVRFCCIRFRFFSTSQDIGWEESLWNDLRCVQLDVKPWLKIKVKNPRTPISDINGARKGILPKLLQLEQCNPWPQVVANHHISISQLLSLWRHSHYDSACSPCSHYDVIVIVTSFATELATPTVTDVRMYVRTDTLRHLIHKDAL